jgi:hypothetical protein
MNGRATNKERTMPEDTYEVVRFYRDNHPQEIVAEGLTLAEAKEMCSSDEGSSNTCCEIENMKLLAEKGEWFLGFRKE